MERQSEGKAGDEGEAHLAWAHLGRVDLMPLGFEVGRQVAALV